jgi:hypothetical protein
MDNYFHFIIEITSKFINYISSQNNTELTQELLDYILNSFLFFKSLDDFSLDNDILNENKQNLSSDTLYKYDTANKLFKHFIKSKYELPQHYFIQICTTHSKLINTLIQYSIEECIPKNTLGFSDYYGFKYDYQNTITQAIIFVLYSICKYTKKWYIGIQESNFVSEILLPKFKYTQETKNISLKPLLNEILLRYSIFSDDESLNYLSSLWIECNKHSLTIRIICFDRIITKETNRI